MFDVMLKCERCQNVFEKKECGMDRCLFTYYGETPIYDYVDTCPFCGSSCLDEVVQCKHCGEYFVERGEGGCLCDDCLYTATAKDCFEVSKDSKLSVDLNFFIAEMFTPAEIEDILLDVLVKSTVDVSKFIDGDIDWFSDKYSEILERREEQ